MIEFIENFYAQVSAIDHLLIIKGWGAPDQRSELFIKKTIHETIRVLSLSYSQTIFQIELESFNTIDPVLSRAKVIRSLSKAGKSSEILAGAPTRPAYQKVTVLKISAQLTPNNLSYFAICLTKPQVVKYLNYQVSHTGLWVNCHLLVVPKKTKKVSLISEGFIEKIKNIYETPVYPCKKMCNLTKDLIIHELELSINEFLTVLETHNLGNPETNLRPLLSELLKQKLIIKSINRSSVKRIVASLKEINDEVLKQSSEMVNITMVNSLKISNELNSKIKSTSLKNKTLEILINKTQKFLSKMYTINTALLFIDYLLTNQFDYIYYSVYCDFRGRVYYKSRCSPQNYWYYRFLFHLGDIMDYKVLKNTNLIPLS